MGFFAVFVLLLCAAGISPSWADSAGSAPATLLLDGRSLLETRRAVLSGDASAADGIARLRRDADKALREPIRTVTDKPFTPPSGDKHDYVSLSIYYWPNPNSPDGLPYVSRDGEVNPETKQYDSDRLFSMCAAIKNLTLAYYLTGQESYAERAAEQLRAWFLDEKTRMNPNLKYGQLVKGKSEGSRWGIIDTYRLPSVIDGDALLRTSPSWPAADHQRLQKWFSDYLQWLQTSELGKTEARATNNHGVWYDVQTASYALFCGEKERAHQILEESGKKRIAEQIDLDGSQPLELKRTWNGVLAAPPH